MKLPFGTPKENFGFDTYQLRDRKSLDRFAQLSFTAATLTQLAFSPLAMEKTSEETDTDEAPLDLETVLSTLNIHWYKPKHLTRGLMTAYLQRCLQQNYFYTGYDPRKNAQKKLKIPEDTT